MRPFTFIVPVALAVLGATLAPASLVKIVPRELAENAALMAVLAYGLADADVPLSR